MALGLSSFLWPFVDGKGKARAWFKETRGFSKGACWANTSSSHTCTFPSSLFNFPCGEMHFKLQLEAQYLSSILTPSFESYSTLLLLPLVPFTSLGTSLFHKNLNARVVDCAFLSSSLVLFLRPLISVIRGFDLFFIWFSSCSYCVEKLLDSGRGSLSMCLLKPNMFYFAWNMARIELKN